MIGVETSQPFDCLYQDGVEICTEAQIDSGLQELWDLGVRSLFPVHKFDNAFGGTKMDAGTAGLLVNVGNDWIEDLRHVAGQEIVDELARGAEAYLQMWERASTPQRGPKR